MLHGATATDRCHVAKVELGDGVTLEFVTLETLGLRVRLGTRSCLLSLCSAGLASRFHVLKLGVDSSVDVILTPLILTVRHLHAGRATPTIYYGELKVEVQGVLQWFREELLQ